MGRRPPIAASSLGALYVGQELASCHVTFALLLVPPSSLPFLRSSTSVTVPAPASNRSTPSAEAVISARPPGVVTSHSDRP